MFIFLVDLFNKLMKAYKENMDNRDMMYEEETRARIEKDTKQEN